jgi:IS30 family transposase
MKTNYKHLALEQRYLIQQDLKSGLSIKMISSKIGVHRSTVYREIKRNSGKKGYRFKQAQSKTQSRCLTKVKKKKLTPLISSKINNMLKQKWSPEQISGRLKKEFKIAVSHETIYQYIWNDKANKGKLYLHLRRSGKKYNKRSKTSAGRGCIPNRIDISKRPKVVERKKQLGHFKGDTIIGQNHKGAILTLVERTSKILIIKKMKSKDSKKTAEHMITALKPIKNTVRTMTLDNGKEFSKHEKVSKELRIKTYFAKPYHSWERGLNEHTNGLIRQYIPKKTDFTCLTKKELLKIQYEINNRPRKSLGYLTPREVFLRHTGIDVNVALQT